MSSCPRFIRISDNMLLIALRKTSTNVIEECIMLFDIYYHQLVHIDDDCVEYDYMKLKWKKCYLL